MCIFSRRSSVGNTPERDPIWPNYDLFRDFMAVLIICKNEGDPIKTEGARVPTSLYVNFSDAQGLIP